MKINISSNNTLWALSLTTFLFLCGTAHATTDILSNNNLKFHDRFGVGIFISPVYSFYSPHKYARNYWKQYQGQMSVENNMGIKTGANLSFQIYDRLHLGISGGVFRYKPNISHSYTIDYHNTLHLDNTDLIINPFTTFYFDQDRQLFIHASVGFQKNLATKSYLNRVIDEIYHEHYDWGLSHLWGTTTNMELGIGKSFTNNSGKRKGDITLTYGQNLSLHIKMPNMPGAIFVNTKTVSLRGVYYLK